MTEVDMVNHPPHYRAGTSGVECIQVVEHLQFCTGNAVKYLWRFLEKSDPLEDLKKALWYANRAHKRGEITHITQRNYAMYYVRRWIAGTEGLLPQSPAIVQLINGLMPEALNAIERLIEGMEKGHFHELAATQ